MTEQHQYEQGIDRPREELSDPRHVRAMIRTGEWSQGTFGLARDYAQANLVILPAAEALDFLSFCVRNPKPCPVLDVTSPGSPHPRHLSDDADLRTDVPRYRVYRYGELVDEPTDIGDLWQDDFVGVLLGCSYTFERALVDAGIPVRHWELNVTVPMYVTNRQCVPSDRLRGELVVSMRPMPHELIPRAVEITSRYPRFHGAPVHIGAPEALGVQDISRPDFGDPVPVREGEAPVFWACGVTPQRAGLASKTPLMITHAPGHMFITDVPESSF